MSVWSFFESIWHSFLNDLEPANQFLATLPLLGYSIGVFAWIRHSYLGRNKNLSIELMEEKEAAQKWLKMHNEIALELEAEKRCNPTNWLPHASKILEDEGIANSLGYLRDEFTTAAPFISATCVKLGNHHLAVWPEQGPQHLIKAKDFFHISLLLNGTSVALDNKLKEIKFLLENQSDIPTEEFDNWNDLFTAYTSEGDSLSEVSVLNRKIVQLLDEQHSETALALSNQAVSIAQSLSIEHASEKLEAYYWKAHALHFVGMHTQGLELTDQILAEKEKLGWADSDNRAIYTRDLRVQIFDSLGRYQDALEETSELDQLVGEPDGKNGRTIHLKAWVLINNGRYVEAEVELKRVGPLLHDHYLTNSSPKILMADYLSEKINLKEIAKGLRRLEPSEAE